MSWWVHDLYHSDKVLLVSWIFWVIFSITMHELAHGWAAIWQGDDTPRRYDRMTMNPIVHMGPFSLIMFALIGIAWGVMPTDPSQYRWGRRGRIVVAGAGPAMNIVLAFISLTAGAFCIRYAPPTSNFAANVQTFLLAGGWLNLALAAFNLLPMPPLDGSSILAGMSRQFYRWMHHPHAPMVGMFLLLFLFMRDAGGIFFGAAIRVAGFYAHNLAGLLP